MDQDQEQILIVDLYELAIGQPLTANLIKISAEYQGEAIQFRTLENNIFGKDFNAIAAYGIAKLKLRAKLNMPQIAKLPKRKVCVSCKYCPIAELCPTRLEFISNASNQGYTVVAKLV
jgi:hypothetical protein